MEIQKTVFTNHKDSYYKECGRVGAAWTASQPPGRERSRPFFIVPPESVPDSRADADGLQLGVMLFLMRRGSRSSFRNHEPRQFRDGSF